MPKTITAGLSTSMGLTTGTFASLWLMTRVDGTIFRFTDLDDDITFNGDLYTASVGYNRTAVSNRVGLNVDNLDVSGFLDSSQITEVDLRGGKFDFATIVLMLIDYTTPADGVLQMRTGMIGEVKYTDDGSFETELRGLTQPYSQQLVELYQVDCRTDLGSARCQIELFPDIVTRTTNYVVGDIVRATDLIEGILTATLLLPLDDAPGVDISPNGFAPSINQGTVDTTKFKFGGAGRNFTTSQRMSYADDTAFEIGANDFTVEAWVNLDTVSATQFAICSRYDNGGNDRVFFLEINEDRITLFLSDDGTSSAPAASYRPFPSGGILAATWYHVAATRDANKVIRIYLDGVQINGSRTDTISVGSTTTFTRTVGSFINDGFLGNQTIDVSGFGINPGNNGTFTTVSATDLTLTIVETTLTIEAGAGTEIIESMFEPDVVTNTDEPFALAFINSTTDIRFDGTIDDLRFLNGAAAYTGTSFAVPTSALSPGVSQALLDSLVSADFDDRIYTCTIAGATNGAVQPAYDPIIGNPTVDGTCTFVAGEAFTRAGVVSGFTDNRVFGTTWPNVADTRLVADWYKYGAVKWETGNNAGLVMDVKGNALAVSTGTITMGVTDTNTFNRSAGSFITDGFVVGMTINTLGFTDGANNGAFTVAAVGTTTLDVTVSTLVAESGTADETMISDDNLSLFLSMPFDIQVGDTFSIYAGCDKLAPTCIAKFDNILNYRAERFVPGQDAFLRINQSR